jgi:hypothetical protein
VRDEIDFIFVKSMDDVIANALLQADAAEQPVDMDQVVSTRPARLSVAPAD